MDEYETYKGTLQKADYANTRHMTIVSDFSDKTIQVQFRLCRFTLMILMSGFQLQYRIN